MKKYYSKIESKGLPGGPNEQFTYITGVFSSDVFSTEGYKRNSPDKNNPYNIIPSGRITMQDVDFPVFGMDDVGNAQMMYPGGEYQFPGSQVTEIPMAQYGIEKWGFLNSGKEQREYVVGSGLNFPTGTGINAIGVIPKNSDPVFKGVGSFGVTQKLGNDFNIGTKVDIPFLNDNKRNEAFPSLRAEWEKNLGDFNLKANLDFPLKDPSYKGVKGQGSIIYNIPADKKKKPPILFADGGVPMAQTGLEVKQRRGVRNNPDGSVSSHLMKAEYVDGRGWVAFPTLFQDSKPYADDNQNWVDMSEEEDWMKIYEEAVRRGEVYDFGEDKEAALAFGMGSWKDQLPEHLQDKKYGGIPKGQTGGTIYVDPNDLAGRERYQAYQDSLNLYDEYMDMYNLALNTNAGTREQVARRYNIEQDPTASHLFHLVGTNLGSGKQYMNARNTTDVNPNILPIAARSYADDYNARTSPFLAEYKKPVQPIKYHDPEIVAKQKELIAAGYDIGGADGIWGPKSQTAWEEYQNNKIQDGTSPGENEFLTAEPYEGSTNNTTTTNTNGTVDVPSWKQVWIEDPESPAEGYWKKVYTGTKIDVSPPQYQTGGPIIVPQGDYRAQAYADSLTLYNQGRRTANAIDPFIKDKGYITWDEWKNSYYTDPNTARPTDYEAFERLMKLNQESPAFGKGTKKIEYPIGDIGVSPINEMQTKQYALYAKPKNIVFEEGSKEAQNAEKQKELKEAGLYEGDIDGIWGEKSQAAWEAYEASLKPVEENKPTEEIKETETPATTSDSDAEIIGYIRETYYDTDTNSNQTKYRPVKKGEAIPTDGTFVSYKGSAPQYQTGGGTGKSPDDPDYKGVGTAYGNHEPYTPTAEELLSLFTNEVIEPSIEVAGTSTPIINNVTNNPNFPINSNLNFQDPQEYSLPQPPEYEYIQMDDGSFVLVDVKKTPPIVLPVGGVEYKSGGSTSNSFSKWMKNNNLPKAQTGGGTVKVKAAATPKLKKVRATAEDQILTYKDNADWFDSRAVYSGNPQYDDLIKKRVYSGNYGYNPATGAVVPLNTRPAPVEIEDNILTYKDNSDWFDGHAKYHDDPAYDESIRKAVYSGKWGYNPATQMLYPLKKEDQVEIPEIDRIRATFDEEEWQDTQERKREREVASQLRAENRQPMTIDEIGSRSNPLLREQDKTGSRPWEGKEGQTLWLTEEETAAYYKDWVAKSNVAMGENPLFYAPGIIAGAAFAPAALAGLGEATYGALAPAFSAPATIAGTTIPVATAGNLINAGFAGHGLYNVFPDAIDFATNPSWEGAGNLAIDALEIAPIARAAGRGTVEGYNAAKQAANKLGNKYLPNAYKYNPKALKETPEVIMYRTQKPGQTEELMELKKLQQKRDTEGISSLSTKEKIYLSKLESRPGFGQGFDTEVARIGYYGNPNIRNTRSYQETPEILRVKVPREQAAGYNVSNFPDYRKISTSPRTEHLLPHKLIESAEKLSFDDYARLVQEDKVFNTPHWLTGYGSKTPKQLPGSPNTPTSWFNGERQNALLVEQARRSGEAPLPDYMVPYISRRYTPATKQQEIFESFLSPKQQAKLRELRTQRFTREGPGSSNAVSSIDDVGKSLTQKQAVQFRAERMLSQENKWVGQNNQELRIKFENAQKNHNPASDYPGEKLGTNKGYSTEVSKDALLSEANKARIAAHETGHYYRNRATEANEWNSFFDFSKLEKHKTRTYLRGKPTATYKNSTNNISENMGLRLKKDGVPHGDEIRERAAQLKDYIAQKNGIPLNEHFVITQPMLDDAIKNYVKDTGLDNNMTQMLNALKDKKGFLKALNKYALTTIGAAVGTRAAASSNKYQQGGEIIPDNVKKMKAALDKELEAVKNYNLTPAKKNKLIQELYATYNENVPPKFKLGGPVLSTELQMYKDYIMGKNESPEALKNYDKLNRVHYKKAKANNMAPSNYIMTELIS